MNISQLLTCTGRYFFQIMIDSKCNKVREIEFRENKLVSNEFHTHLEWVFTSIPIPSLPLWNLGECARIRSCGLFTLSIRKQIVQDKNKDVFRYRAAISLRSVCCLSRDLLAWTHTADHLRNGWDSVLSQAIKR